MDNPNLIQQLKALGGRLRLDEPMAEHTTFKVGGPADFFFEPDSPDAVAGAFRVAEEAGIPCLLIGNGSNLIVRDGGIRGLVVSLGDAMARIEVEGCTITAQAGVRLSSLSRAALSASLAGLEFAAGIPGTVGGGVAMNAGAYGGQISDVLLSAEVLLQGGQRAVWSREDMQMGYRSTRALREGGVVLSAVFECASGETDQIRELISELGRRRREKQPLTMPSAGSVFKRPEGHFAGGLIEQAGLKGRSVGGAQVSELHAGFIVNTGGATASDILELVRQVKAEVKALSGVELEMEIRVVGEP